MYVKRIQIANYGPINRLDIAFPFENDRPKPVVLVGPNGSGKSILLSHIVNGMLLGQHIAYPNSPEVETGKVYKLRTPNYIAHDEDFSFARVDYNENLWIGELQLSREKQNFSHPPSGIIETDANTLWNDMKGEETSKIEHGSFNNTNHVETILSNNCVLYFPPDRYEDPAWLNETNLLSKASHLDLIHLQGYTDRKIINYSPLDDNQQWLFNLAYDFSVFERRSMLLPVVDRESGRTVNVHASVDLQGHARQLYNSVLSIVREVLIRKDDVRLGIGPRHNRTVSLISGDKTLVPNIFQLSSGEVSILNLFLSILRDCDLTDIPFNQTDGIKGIVAVDEIDIHLHTRHKYEILPKLISMFPNVQFVITSHSPLFVLGLQQVLGEDGFGLYDLPSGQQLSAEDFGEFGTAYEAFVATKRHTDEVRSAVQDAQKPLVFVEGPTDVNYMNRAAELLEFNSLLATIEIREGGGTNLKNVWKGLTTHHVNRKRVIVLHDPECTFDETTANVFRRSMGWIEDHPIQKGIENLFSQATLERARAYKRAFIDTAGPQEIETRGVKHTTCEIWTVNNNEKTCLCNWLCQNGTADDFQHFLPVLEMLRKIIEDEPEELVK